MGRLRTASLGWVFTLQVNLIKRFRQSTLATSACRWWPSESDQQRTGLLRGRPGWPWSRVCVACDQRPVCVASPTPSWVFLPPGFCWTIQNFHSRYLESSCCAPMGQTPYIIPSHLKLPILSGEGYVIPNCQLRKLSFNELKRLTLSRGWD